MVIHMKKLRAAVAAFVLVPALAACSFGSDGSGDGAEGAGTGTQSGSVTNEITAGITEVDTFNPLYTQSDTVSDVCGFVFEPLFGIDPSLRTMGVLADSYEISSDGSLLTIHLKQDVYWHDGAVFTAADAVYTANLIKYGGTRYDRLMEQVDTVWAVDNYTVCVRFRRAVPDPTALFTFPIIKNNSGTDSFSAIGTGPFYFDSTNNLTATDWYHDGRASIDRINIKTLPDDEKLISMLDASVVDFLTAEKLDMSSYMQKSNSHVWDYVSNEMVFIGFNMNSSVFSDVYARRAVSMLADRDDIVNSVYYMRAQSSEYAVNPCSWAAFDKSSKHHADAQGAIELLTSNGWSEDSGGAYYKSGARTLYFSVRILVNEDSAQRVQIAETLAEAMNAVGLRAVVDKCSAEAFPARILARNYDMFIGETALLPNCDITPLAVTGQNSFGYSSPEVDALVAQLGIVTLEADIRNVTQALYERLHEDAPFAPICFMKKSMVTSAKLRNGVNPSVGGYVRDTVHWGV